MDLFFLASAALDACASPAQPADPPDGDHATRAQMLASQNKARAFDAATNAYLACLDQAAHDFEGQYGRALTAANVQQIQGLQNRMHNSAVDVDHGVADRFNKQLHIFLARSRS